MNGPPGPVSPLGLARPAEDAAQPPDSIRPFRLLVRCKRMEGV
jgi:hypothetical protein